MRLHPIVWAIPRTAAESDVIPLAYPVVAKSGQRITEIPIRKGQTINISVCAYNRVPEIWGTNAHEWCPQRFLDTDKSKQTAAGIYANLLNFSGGVRACIGWRFSVIQQQVAAATLLEHFQFMLPDKPVAISRKPTALMMPLADGLGLWMGLKVQSIH